MGISTEYRGYSVTYNEGIDKWYCHEINVSDSALSKVRLGIDRVLAAERKDAAVPCLLLLDFRHTYGTPSLTDAIVTAVHARKGGRRDEGTQFEYHAVYAKGGSNRRSRGQVDRDTLLPDTQQTRDAFQVFLKAREEVREAHQRADKALAAIPRLSEEDFAKIAKICEQQDLK
jgi:hypothetical protein